MMQSTSHDQHSLYHSLITKCASMPWNEIFLIWNVTNIWWFNFIISIHSSLGKKRRDLIFNPSAVTIISRRNNDSNKCVSSHEKWKGGEVKFPIKGHMGLCIEAAEHLLHWCSLQAKRFFTLHEYGLVLSPYYSTLFSAIISVCSRLHASFNKACNNCN